MPYRIPKVLDYPFDCTKCKHFKKPLLKDPEAIRYLCMKGIYMPKWSSLYVSCKFCSCLDFEPTPESGVVFPEEERARLRGIYTAIQKKRNADFLYQKCHAEKYQANNKKRNQKEKEFYKQKREVRKKLRELPEEAAIRHIR